QNPALADEGALADLTASLAEGVAALVRQGGERGPGGAGALQGDEPSLRAVLEAAGAYTVVHCCAAGLPFLFIRDTGARAVSFDLELVGRGDEDAVAEVAESGLGLLVGAVPTVVDSQAA